MGAKQKLQTETFADEWEKLDKTYDKRVRKLIKEICKDPLRKSELMVADYKGLRKRRKGRIRILYAYCKDCRERGDDVNRACAICNDVDDETIIFFHVGLKGILYEE